jgi:hypothetical protein
LSGPQAIIRLTTQVRSQLARGRRRPKLAAREKYPFRLRNFRLIIFPSFLEQIQQHDNRNREMAVPLIHAIAPTTENSGLNADVWSLDGMRGNDQPAVHGTLYVTGTLDIR